MMEWNSNEKRYEVWKSTTSKNAEILNGIEYLATRESNANQP